MNWKNIPAGEFATAQEKLWNAFGDAADQVIARMTCNRSFSYDLAKFAITRMAQMDRRVISEIIELGSFLINHNESVVEKCVSMKSSGLIRYISARVSDANFPDERTGKIRVNASVIRFEMWPAQEHLEKWCAENNKFLARPKEGIDIFCSMSDAIRHKIVSSHLAFAGQLHHSTTGHQIAVCARALKQGLCIDDYVLGPPGDDIWNAEAVSFLIWEAHIG